jgi:ribosomal protein L9
MRPYIMTKSLLEALPKIVADGKRQAAQILEQLESRHRVTLQTRELVIPAKSDLEGDLFRALSTQHSALSTQHSALSTQHSALSTQHSALSTQRVSIPHLPPIA